MAAVLKQGQVKALLSDDHFSVDGTLIEAWASMKSFRPKDGSGAPPSCRTQWATAIFMARSAATRRRARRHRPRCPAVSQGAETARQACRDPGHVLMDNRHALGGRRAANLGYRYGRTCRPRSQWWRHCPGNHRITLGADKAYDVAEFVADLREYNVTPHVAQNITNRRSAIDRRTTRHPGYAVSGRMRKRIEEVFGWTKGVSRLLQDPSPWSGSVSAGMFTLTATAYNLIRRPKPGGDHGLTMSGICPDTAVPTKSTKRSACRTHIGQLMRELALQLDILLGNHSVFPHPARAASDRSRDDGLRSDPVTVLGLLLLDRHAGRASRHCSEDRFPESVQLEFRRDGCRRSLSRFRRTSLHSMGPASQFSAHDAVAIADARASLGQVQLKLRCYL